MIAAADGTALADPTFRRVIDTARAHTPAELGCVIDASLTSEAVAFAASKTGATIVIVTRALVARCPALSKIGEDVYVATIGSGAVRVSTLAPPLWTRLRPYLEREPIAIAAVLDTTQVLVVAQPSPLDAWVSIDGPIEHADASLKVLVEKWRASNAALASRMRIARQPRQLVVRVDKVAADDLVAITGDVLTALDRPRLERSPELVCPPGGNLAGIVSCTANGTQLAVDETRRALDVMTNGDVTPEISAGDVIGLRLQFDPPALLKRGDIILGLDETRVISREQLQKLILRAGQNASLAVRRDDVDLVLKLTQVE